MRARFLIFGCALLLAGCGDADVSSACFKNGDHENMSDGKITGICDCVTTALKKGNVTERENQWIIAWFNRKPPATISDDEKKQADKLIAELVQLKARCTAAR